MTNIIPNHSQAQRIERDIRRLAANFISPTSDDWRGNSYSMLVESTGGVKSVRYVHWNTTIAEIFYASGTTEKVRVTYFDARYISATTRGFQSRIVKGMGGLIPADQMSRIVNELALPTGQRGVLTWEV